MKSQSRNCGPRVIGSFELVGTGLAARALGPALIEAGLSLRCVAGRSPERTKELAAMLRVRGIQLDRFVPSSDLTLLCVPEMAVEEVCKGISGCRELNGCAIVHLSGMLPVDALATARSAGARTGKLHPVASLAGGPLRLSGIAWGIAGEPDLTAELRHLVEQLGGIPVDLSHVDAALYHLAAVFASNYVLAVLAVASELWQRAGTPLPPSEALLPLVRGTLANYADLGIEGALTGPIMRGDPAAVERQMRTITQAAPEFERLYRALAVATADIATRIERVDDSAIAEIIRLVASTDGQ